MEEAPAKPPPPNPASPRPSPPIPTAAPLPFAGPACGCSVVARRPLPVRASSRATPFALTCKRFARVPTVRRPCPTRRPGLHSAPGPRPRSANDKSTASMKFPQNFEPPRRAPPIITPMTKPTRTTEPTRRRRLRRPHPNPSSPPPPCATPLQQNLNSPPRTPTAQRQPTAALPSNPLHPCHPPPTKQSAQPHRPATRRTSTTPPARPQPVLTHATAQPPLTPEGRRPHPAPRI